ncbi:patatin-like phospholipase family protein [Clostridium sp. Cult2]|uniref:patatin-like phospholipase family protein n=1 Tax=Clostridium sp. Cult2 TaxID=2079003 RepID=UPI001F1CADD4|nr:patatin family protein [Clostridium sp. Cult2]MCF6465339.1 patatin family protein [Clostridium sp. Cult2]
MHEKLGLVLEGGGMRGAYTSGVLGAFMDENIKFPYVIGVSAGANNGANFVAEQRERNKKVFVDYVSHKDYSGFRHFIKGKSYFNMEFLFDTLPNQLIPFDYETFFDSPTIFKVCVTDVETGCPKYFEKSQSKAYGKEFMNKILRASSSLPIISPPVEINGKLYFDGGITDSIPIEKSIEDGNPYNVVVLTRNRDYIKKEQKLGIYSKHYLKKYPKIMKAIENRHIKYNITLETIDKLEREGYIFVFRPIASLMVDRLEKDTSKLNSLYNQGYTETLEKMDDYKKWLENISED